MNRPAILCATAVVCLANLILSQAAIAEPLKALIVDGQNNHDWKATTPVMQAALLDCGRFTVDVATSPAGRDLSSFAPRFADYDVVISNYNGHAWSKETQQALLDYVHGGGGFVVIHAANNAFGDWKEYNEMIGLGGWGGRNEQSGPYVYFEDDKLVRDNRKGSGGNHGTQHDFQVVLRDTEHPITRGMPTAWMHHKDELYHDLRGPGAKMKVLATAYSDPATRGSGRHEPMMMTIDYGKGRVFHTPMGHGDYSMKCQGYVTCLQRGSEWAATGEVTLPVPENFPSAKEVRMWAPRASAAQDELLVFEGGEGPGRGKHIVLVSGDEEYRSEEVLPQLGKILAVRHGFKCTVLFSMDPKTGEIDPINRANIPGLETLEDADLMVIATRFRDLVDDQMAHLDRYVQSGKPIVGLRTATHGFNIEKGKKYAHYSYNSKEWDGGFGRQVLGETWAGHHGHHGQQSTRGLLVESEASHPILRGLADGDVWGPTDVYGVRLPLPGDSRPLVLGQVLVGMKPDDAPLAGEKNDPMMPLAWTKSFTGDAGKKARVFTSTLGASQDLVAEGSRRLLVNACYWAVGLEEQIQGDSNVDLVGTFEPSPFKFGGGKKGVRPADHRIQ